MLLGPAVGLELVLCTDAAVEGVHADLTLLSPADLGWRATVATLSDLAAMGARPTAILAAVCSSSDVPATEIMEGVADAAREFSCPVVGGDLTTSATATVAITALGTVPTGSSVGRDGASGGDTLFVTGPLGASAAGLRLLRSGASAPSHCIEAHRRPVPRLAEGAVGRRAGATAMIDVSDGLSLDLDRLAVASGVGVRLDSVPVAEGASLDEALYGGEDYELLIATADPDALRAGFAAEGLNEPIMIGVLSEEASERSLDGEALVIGGFDHDVA